MKKILFKGSGTAIATPFTKDNLVNFDELRKFLEFQIAEGTDAIIVCGTTGESATMTEQERKDVIKFTVQVVNKRIPVIAGTGSNCTKSAIEMSEYAKQVGADGLLIVTPYYNKATQQGLISHYQAIASKVDLPIILYNVPSRTGVNIEPETCLELSKIPNIVGIKEASGNLSQVAKIASLCKDDLTIYSGNDDQVLPILSLGGLGVVSVLSNIAPKEVHSMVWSFLQGNLKPAISSQLEMLPVIQSLFCEVNPIPIKAALNMIGFDFGIPRLPLTELSHKNTALVEEKVKVFKR
jgi:dihydrodipicolinate synthase